MTATFTLTGDLQGLLGSRHTRTAFVEFSTTVTDTVDDVVFWKDSTTVRDGLLSWALPAYDPTILPYDVAGPQFSLRLTIGDRTWTIAPLEAGETFDLSDYVGEWEAPSPTSGAAFDTTGAAKINDLSSAMSAALKAGFLSVGTTTVDVEKYGGDLNAAITANSGTNIRFVLARPTYTLTASAIANAGGGIEGVGDVRTTITIANGVNDDVVKGVNFNTLTGKAYSSSDINAGAVRFTLKNLKIDGNKANQSSGYGVRIWGPGLKFHDVLVANCKSGNIWTEFTTHPDGSIGSMIEGNFRAIKSHGSDGNAWDFRGPHDSNIHDYNPVGNAGYGFVNASLAGHYVGGIKGSNWNSWLNGAGSYDFGAEFALTNSIASGASGLGINMAPGLGSCSFQGTIGGHTDGIVVRGTGHEFNLRLNNLSGKAVELGSSGAGNEAGNIELSMVGTNVGTALTQTNQSGPVDARGLFSTIGTALLAGASGSSLDRIFLVENGNAAATINKFPANGFTARGWNPKFPLSNGVLLTKDATGTTVGAAGAASALPATPTAYWTVKDETGTTFKIPVYAP